MTELNLQGFLSSSALFGDMTPAELGRISQACKLKTLGKGDMVFRCGDACESFHMVVSGQVKLFVTSAQGHEKVIEIFSPGQSFAEAIMFLDKPYIFNAQALTDAVLVEVAKRGVYAEIVHDPKFAMHMLGGVSRRLQVLIQDVEGYALKNGVQRLVAFLLKDLDPVFAPGCRTLRVTLPASKITVASRLSLTPEYFSRVLHDLQGRHLIEIDKRAILIPDLHALQQHASA